MALQSAAEIRALIARHKRWDIIFGIIGILCLAVGLMTFVTLFVDMLVDGYARLTPDFFTRSLIFSLPSGSLI